MSEILKLIPAFKSPIWSGENLKKIYKENSPDKIGEAWVLSAHKDGQSVVTGGNLDGLTLSEALEKMGKEALGKKAEGFEFFPQLIKFIDTSDFLSVQVHPSDDYALTNEGQYGKTEVWYIIDAQKDCGIYFGLKDSLTKQEVLSKAQDGSIEEKLQFVKVKKGECYFVSPGTIHAIGKGVTLAEVQQNSNLTYRLYDFLRKDKDGNYRELHLDKAAKVSVLEPLKYCKDGDIENIDGGSIKTVAQCEYFTAKALTLKGEFKLCKNDSFVSVVIISGSGKIDNKDFKVGDSYFVPADYGEFTLNGDFEALISYVE